MSCLQGKQPSDRSHDTADTFGVTQEGGMGGEHKSVGRHIPGSVQKHVDVGVQDAV